MLNIGWSELLLVAIVAIVVVGPKDLPKLMRTFGVYAGKLRRAAADFQRQFDEALAESEADEVRKNIEAIRSNMGTMADFAPPPDTPLMTPTRPAAQSIEHAIAPRAKTARTKKASAKKTAAKKTPRKTAAPKRKASPKRKAASPKRKTADKRTTTKTRRKR
jgi:sec-independent protein translocase protein TatB